MLFAGRKLEERPVLMCLRKAALYRCDNPLALGFMVPDLVRVSFHGFTGLRHETLRDRNVPIKALGSGSGFVFQGQQPDIDTEQSLRDFILQFATDLFSFLLLGAQNLMGEVA